MFRRYIVRSVYWSLRGVRSVFTLRTRRELCFAPRRISCGHFSRSFLAVIITGVDVLTRLFSAYEKCESRGSRNPRAVSGVKKRRNAFNRYAYTRKLAYGRTQKHAVFFKPNGVLASRRTRPNDLSRRFSRPRLAFYRTRVLFAFFFELFKAGIFLLWFCKRLRRIREYINIHITRPWNVSTFMDGS